MHFEILQYFEPKCEINNEKDDRFKNDVERQSSYSDLLYQKIVVKNFVNYTGRNHLERPFLVKLLVHSLKKGCHTGRFSVISANDSRPAISFKT